MLNLWMVSVLFVFIACLLCAAWVCSRDVNHDFDHHVDPYWGLDLIRVELETFARDPCVTLLRLPRSFRDYECPAASLEPLRIQTEVPNMRRDAQDWAIRQCGDDEGVATRDFLASCDTVFDREYTVDRCIQSLERGWRAKARGSIHSFSSKNNHHYSITEEEAFFVIRKFKNAPDMQRASRNRGEARKRRSRGASVHVE